MKYLLVVGDGMADLPIEALGGKTPLEYLNPKGFQIVGGGELGRLRSCPTQLPPGSDTAFLTLLGNDTPKVYTCLLYTSYICRPPAAWPGGRAGLRIEKRSIRGQIGRPWRIQ